MSVLDRLRPDATAVAEPAPLDPLLEGPGAPWGPRVVEAVAALRAEQTRRADAGAAIDRERAEVAATATASAERAYDDPQVAADMARESATRLDELDIRERGLEVGDRRVAAAVTAVLRAQAEDLRARVRTAARDLRKVEARTAELLAQLQAHEGCPYEPAEIQHQDEMRFSEPYGRPRHRARSEQLRRDARDLVVLVWLLEHALAGRPTPDVVLAGRWDVWGYPASLRGAHALVGPASMPMGDPIQPLLDEFLPA